MYNSQFHNDTQNYVLHPYPSKLGARLASVEMVLHAAGGAAAAATDPVTCCSSGAQLFELLRGGIRVARILTDSFCAVSG